MDDGSRSPVSKNISTTVPFCGNLLADEKLQATASSAKLLCPGAPQLAAREGRLFYTFVPQPTGPTLHYD
jgi:hypothetical protein